MVVHTQQVLQSITEIDAALSQAEAAQRGYLLAATKPFLDERDQALRRVTDRLQLLRALTSDNPLQQGRIAAIEGKIPGRIVLMHENAAIRDSAGLGAVGTRVSMGEGQRASASIYNETAGLRTEELRLLEKRQEDAASLRAYAQAVLIAAALIGLMVLIPGYIALVLQSRDRERSKRNLQLMADALPGAVYQVRHDPDGKPNLMFISAGARKLRGLPREVDIDLPTLTAQIDERDRQAFLDALEHARTSLEPLSYEYRVHLSDGSMRWMHHEATMLRENDGSVLANGYVADVTRRHELQLALHEAREAADDASHAKSTFLATMSHEIRTPMNAVQGMLELLSLTRLDAEQRATLAIIQQSGRSLLRIIDDVLDFSKIEARRLDVRPEPASIAAVIDDVYNIYLGNASSKGLWLGKRVDPAISPALSVDALRLRQILSNFVSNAIKFTTFGSIEIAVDLIERKDDVERLRFSVKDTGPGIAAEDQRRLFQPFMQGEGAARGKAGVHRPRPHHLPSPGDADGRIGRSRERSREGHDAVPRARFGRSRSDRPPSEGGTVAPRDARRAGESAPCRAADRRCRARGHTGAPGRRSSDEPDAARAPDADARLRVGERRRWRRSPREMEEWPLRIDRHRLQHAGDGWVCVGARHSRDRRRAWIGADADHRVHGERAGRRGRALFRGGDGRLSGEAGDTRAAAGANPELAAVVDAGCGRARRGVIRCDFPWIGVVRHAKRVSRTIVSRTIVR